MSRRENLCFLTRNVQSRQNSTFWNLVFNFPLWMMLKPWTLSFKKDTITAKTVSTAKVEIYLANEGYGLAFFSTDLGHIFGSNSDNELVVMLREKSPHKPEFAWNFFRIHSLMINTDLIEYKIVGDTKIPLLPCFPFFSKLQAVDMITSGQYMNYQTFGNLQFRPLLKFFFIVFTLTSETRAVKNYPLYLSASLILFWCSEKRPTIIFYLKDVTRWLLQDK